MYAERTGARSVEDRSWVPSWLFFLVWALWLNAFRLLTLPNEYRPRAPGLILDVAYWLLWALVFWPFATLIRRYPIEGPHRLRRLALFSGLGLPPAIAHGVLVVVLRQALGFTSSRSLGASVVFDLALGQLLYWTMLMLEHASHYHQTTHDAEVRAARLEEQVALARIDGVRTTIRLDLLVARLSDIAARLREDPQSADDRVVRLGRYLRRKLDRSIAAEPATLGHAPLEPAPLSPSTPADRDGWFDWRAESLLLMAWAAAYVGSCLGMNYVRYPQLPLSHALLLAANLGLHASLWSVVCLPLGAIVERYPIESPHRLRRLAAYSGLGLLFGLAHAGVFFLLGRAWLPDNPFPAWVAATSESSLTSFRAGLMSDLSRHQMTFACFLVVKHTWYFRRRYRRQVAHTAALGAELATAQLRALHMQLHPHFVFNTLHSLSELIHENPPAAERMALRLADLLRTAFDGRGQQLVTLDRELAFVDSYLGIQKIRFQDRLVTELDVSPDVRSWLVPNLLLQPLVENAIKHGIAQRLEGGVVRVRCAKEQGKLRIEVTDEGSPRRDPSPDAGRRTGLGLRNTESRLRRLYGQGCDLRLEWNEKGGATASVEIPASSLPARPTRRS